jgi:hypothetical protein
VVLFAAAHAAAAALAAAADFNNDFSSQQSTVDLPLHSTFWTPEPPTSSPPVLPLRSTAEHGRLPPTLSWCH